MRKGKVWSLAIMLLLVFSTVLAACSGGDNESGEKDKGKNTSEQSSSGSGETLVFGRGGDSTSLDPSRTTEGETFKVTINLFETLLTFEDEGTAVEPGLAKSWEPSEDGLTYTFELQEGVKFHDGTDFNAEAVVKNFERWASGDAEKFPYYNSMFGGFEGDEGHVIESVTAEGEHTVVIKLTRPQAPFLKNLAMDMFAIASPTAIEEQGDDDFERNPVGTGPFKFVEWKPNDSITIERFDDYWQEDFPKLEKVIFRSIPDNAARLNALMAGEIDLADGINPSDGASIEGNPDLQLFERPSMNVGYLGLTVTREPFDNKLVRQAMNHAIDKQSIIDAFFEGRADIAVNPMPPSVSGYNDEIEGYEYNPEKAKELLEEAGYGDGFEMELWAMPVPRPYMPDGEKVAEVIQKNLADIGITAKIVSHEWATYLELASKGDADAFMLGWTGDNGDPDNFLYVLLDEDNIGSNNYTYFKNDETHELFIEAQTEVDEEKRIELYKKAQEILHEEAPWVPLAHSIPLLAGSKDITGFLPHPTGSDLLSNVDIER
ncbi:ABC transporter substrate-binding protein [Sporosarcina pasteurii]|uniref:Hemin-binding lipoprotein n=1 Tax=Sporosarcina pasteurii TaxID=1474 RepID=A0A380CAB7_SPOPA|nr:ABC transporter substrate-binding protein [Sporosarcina pasteurii]MDS9473326.1 ABC transporter substrate-binding protein [Sporosarcina pasteurii]QBQ04291.1 ABC transporter substrate-binding protein [Sporosarcina pasteurii]SUJ16657.1 Hemin-binding lipoprotein [Sporosarcina pasteurii]